MVNCFFNWCMGDIVKMNGADILVIIVVTLIMLAILFFSFIYPTFIKKDKNHCSSCPVNKKAKIKRAFKDYHKQNK